MGQLVSDFHKDTNPDLALTLSAVRRLCGEDAVAALLGERAGARVFIPTVALPHHQLSQIVGNENAKLLAEVFGGMSLEIPTHRARHVADEVERLTLLGTVARKIARDVGCTRRTVFAVRARLRRQGRL